MEQLLRHEVQHLDLLLEDERLQAALKERKLQQVLSQERLRSDQLRMLRDNAIVQRYGGDHIHKPEPACEESCGDMVARGEHVLMD